MKTLAICAVMPLLMAAAPLHQDSIYQAPLAFQTQDGKPARLVDWKGHKVVLAMMYASCQSACPMIMGKLKAVESTLKQQKVPVDFVVVTLDPEHDTPETLRAYRVHMKLDQPNWTFLVGKEADTRTLSNLLGFRYRQNPESKEIMHDNRIFLLNEQGVVVQTLEGLEPYKGKLF